MYLDIKILDEKHGMRTRSVEKWNIKTDDAGIADFRKMLAKLSKCKYGIFLVWWGIQAGFIAGYWAVQI